MSFILGEWLDIEQAEVDGVIYRVGTEVEFVDPQGAIAKYNLKKLGRFEKSSDDRPQFGFEHSMRGKWGHADDYKAMHTEELRCLLQEVQDVKAKKRSVFKVTGHAWYVASDKIEIAVTAVDENEALERFHSYIEGKDYSGVRDDLPLQIDCLDEDEAGVA